MKKHSSLLVALTLMASMIGPLPVQGQSASTGGLQMIVYPQTQIMVRRGDYVQYAMFLHNNAAATSGQTVRATLAPGNWELIPSGVSPGCTQTDASTVTCADPSSIGYADQHKYIVTYRIQDTMPCGTVLDFSASAATNTATSSQRVQSVTVSCSIPEFPTVFSSVYQPTTTHTIIYPQHRVGVRRGDTVQYTVMAHNYSQTPAVNPTIHATLQPEHWDAVPSGLSPGCTQLSSSAIVCQDGSSIPQATSHDFVLSYRIKDTMPCGSILDLNVSVSPQNGGGSSMRASSVIVLCDTPTPPATSQCSDGIDNDGDGATDFPNDFSCSSADDSDETNTKSQCRWSRVNSQWVRTCS